MEKYNRQDKEGLKKFLLQPSAQKELLNLEVLGLNRKDLEDISSDSWVDKLVIHNKQEIEKYAMEPEDYILIWNRESPARLVSVNISSGFYNTETDEIYEREDKLGGELDCTGFRKLKYLGLNTNNIKKIDISQNSELLKLYCYDNLVEEIKISVFNHLEHLECSNNLLTELDVTNGYYLEELNCYDNQLSDLDVSRCLKLKTLHCVENQITELDLTKCRNLEKLFCDDNLLSELNLLYNDSLNTLSFTCSNLQKITLSERIHLKNLFISGDLDAQFEGILTPVPALNFAQHKDLEFLSISCIEMKDLDLFQFKKLKELVCTHNLLENLDISELDNLEELNCSFNNLKNMDLTNNLGLKKIDVSFNNFTSLDISSCTHLEELNIVANPILKKVDVSNSPNCVVIGQEEFENDYENQRGVELFIFDDEKYFLERTSLITIHEDNDGKEQFEVFFYADSPLAKKILEITINLKYVKKEGVSGVYLDSGLNNKTIEKSKVITYENEKKTYESEAEEIIVNYVNEGEKKVFEFTIKTKDDKKIRGKGHITANL